MAFRANESRENNIEQARRYLLPKGCTDEQRQQSTTILDMIIDKLGPVVEGYPAWHPIMAGYDTEWWIPCTALSKAQHRFPRIDHTVWLASGFITCPYPNRGADELIAAVNEKRGTDNAAIITAEPLRDYLKKQCNYPLEDDVILYSPDTTPIIVYCDWLFDLDEQGYIPEKIAVPLMLEHLLPQWKTHNGAGEWNDIKGKILGYPHGAKSSLFVQPKTGQILKNLWEQLAKSGMFD